MPITTEKITAIVDQVASVIAREAEANHNAATPSAATLEVLRSSGILGATVPEEYGGWGLGVHNGKPLQYWQMIRTLARADTSFGQSCQVHWNTVDFSCALGTPAQVETICRRVLDGAIMCAWGATRPGLGKGFGSVEADGEQFVINATKAYATNAGFADIAMLMVSGKDAADKSGIQCVLVDCNSEGINIDYDWWQDAQAMRTTASHKVIFDQVKVRPDALLGGVNEYLEKHLQVRSLSAFASNFLGTIEALTALATTYGKKSKALEEDRFVRRMAALHLSIISLEGIMHRVAKAWDDDDKEVLLLSNLFRWSAGEALVEAINQVSVLTGSSTLFAGNELGRRLIDALMYVRHENNDRLETTVGRGFLGLEADFNFAGLRVADGAAGTG
ncbi:MAG: acyl-CoA/acyl-ACP dehydrogenase [Pseudomonadales bacterium]|nr:acyl-CoA/acyl-ACP dehydrogenase [Pseudomonadales bacterium]